MAEETDKKEEKKKKKRNIFVRIILFFVRIFKAIRELLIDEQAVDAYLESLGVDPAKIDKDKLSEKKEKFKSNFKTIEKYQNDDAPKVDDLVFAEAVAEFVTLYESLKEFFEVVAEGEEEHIPEAMARSAIDVFTMNYFRVRHPGLHAMFELLGIMTEESVQVKKAFQTLSGGIKVDLDRGDVDLELKTEEDVNRFSDAVFSVLGILAFKMIESITTSYGWDPAPIPEGAEAGAADRISRRTFSFSLRHEFNADEACPEEEPGVIVEGHPAIESLLTATAVFVPEEHGGVAFILGLNADETLKFTFDSGWELTLESDLPQAVLRIGNNTGADANANLKVRAALRRHFGEGEKPEPFTLPLLIAGLEIGADFQVQITGTAGEFDLQVVAKDSAFILSGGEGDGFLKRVYPADAMRVNFDFGMGWSNKKNFYFTGGDGLFLHLPIHRRFLRSVVVENISLGITESEEEQIHKLRAEVSTRTGLRIGPFDAVVDTIGLYGEWSTAEDETNNPPVKDFRIGFLPPKGVGLLLDAKVVKGGGYLRLDYEKEEYAGFVELKIGRTTLKAVGILTTKLPDKEDGYSLLLLITAEFKPEAAMGFTLVGVGGLIGVNRTMKLEEIRKGVKKNTLDDILFPDNPIADAPRILATLGNTFPAQDGHYVFGLMAMFRQEPTGTLEIQLGLMLEFTELWPPDKLAIIGVVKAEIEREVSGKKLQILKLQVNFAGTIDFDIKFITFDASIYESKLLSFTLEGDLAFRMIYGGPDKDWLVSLGGFHPHYTPPPLDLPDMKRVKFLMRKEQPRLQVTAYVAVSPNSFQIGLRADLEYKKSKFKVKGYLDIDALLQEEPCYFTVGLAFGATVSWGSTTLGGIDFKGRLSGPTPWMIEGSLTFKVWIFSYTINFCKVFGDEVDTSLSDIQLFPLLQQPLSAGQSWRQMLLNGKPTLVSLRDLRKDKLTAQQTVNGELVTLQPDAGLEISQSVMPLLLRIDRYGGRRTTGPNRFHLQVRDSAGNLMETLEVKEFFAPAQFLKLTDEEKLARRPYESFSSGLHVTGPAGLSSAHFVEQSTDYERKVVDKPAKSAEESATLSEAQPLDTRPLPDELFAGWLGNNAVATSALGKQQQDRRRVRRDRVSLVPEQFVVVDAITSDEKSSTIYTNQAEAEVALDEILAVTPELTGRLTVLSKHEIV